MRVLDSILEQDYPAIEVVISDDSSTDDSAHSIPAYIESKFPPHIGHRYLRQPHNVGYDANLRTAMTLASGDYLFLLGNDDALASPRAIATLARTLEHLDFPDVAYSNAVSYADPRALLLRSRGTVTLGSGPSVALRHFRSFSFFGGLVFRRATFLQHNSSCADGSVYVQIFLAARIIARGGTLASIDEILVAKDVEVGGKRANSHFDVLRSRNTTIHPETGGLDRVGRVACNAVLPYSSPALRAWRAYCVYAQLLAFSYPYWLYSYRTHGASRAALNLALGCFPALLVDSSQVSPVVTVALLPVHVVATLLGLLLPKRLLHTLIPALRALWTR